MCLGVLNMLLQTVTSKMHVLSSYWRKCLTAAFHLIYTRRIFSNYCYKSCRTNTPFERLYLIKVVDKAVLTNNTILSEIIE